ncbi:hypothetical protein [Enterococcus sp. CWB-B31]|uniref:hypothetical protein n=1 Tax=Enterococcus sp. CWB-B31 TaxID=2885159 RepID=UPI001E41210A|nr:hypothetical protein [Enterococcus sp. CWB-B31]MCB5954595.1 hypothetical protein [Enterococcus sp. CWB-B31]
MFKRRRKKEDKPKKPKVTIKEKFKHYKEDRQQKFEQQKNYFASEEDRNSEQYLRDQLFIKNILKTGIVCVILVIAYVVLFR